MEIHDCVCYLNIHPSPTESGRDTEHAFHFPKDQLSYSHFYSLFRCETRPHSLTLCVCVCVCVWHCVCVCAARHRIAGLANSSAEEVALKQLQRARSTHSSTHTYFTCVFLLQTVSICLRPCWLVTSKALFTGEANSLPFCLLSNYRSWPPPTSPIACSKRPTQQPTPSSVGKVPAGFFFPGRK